MIKVCHIVNLITGKTDGVYAHLKMIFQNYDSTKFQHYLIFQGGEKVEKELTDLGVKVFISTTLKKRISIQAFRDIYKVLHKNDIDIVHTHLIKPYAIAGLVNIFLRKEFIFNYHGIFIKKNPYYNFIESNIYLTIHYLIFLFGRVDIVLVPSKRSKELLMQETKLFPEPEVYYNGYSLNKALSKPEPDLLIRIPQITKGKLVIAVIGRLEIDKRLDRAIILTKEIITKMKNVHLLIFGDGTLRNDLQELVQKLELENSVDFFGYVKEIKDYYNLFDIVLFTSDWEGMPLTLWEAMANEVPVVAPDVGGIKEILEENDCGLIYKQGNLIDAEEKVLHLLNNESLRKKLGHNGKSVIEEKYNEKEFIRYIEQVYLNLMSE